MQTRLNAARFKKLREDRLWSQEQLADIAGVSARTIQRLETGATVSFETAKALSAAFVVPVSELTEGAPANGDRPATQEGRDVVLAFWIHLATYLGVIALLSAINAASDRADFWVLWPAIGWGIGVVAHGAAVLLDNRSGKRAAD